MKTDEDYIKRCRLLGQNAATSGNSPVGAMIVKNGGIVSEAEEAAKSKNDITCHAEMEAVRLAVKSLQTNDLSGCVLYTTHEPCVMCSYAIRFHKISKVVYANSSAYLGGIHSSMALLVSDEVPPHWSKPPEIVQVILSLPTV